MRKGIDRIRKQTEKFSETNNKFCDIMRDVQENTKEVRRNVKGIKNDFSNIHIIISDVEKNFKEKTAINNSKDLKFLWGAIALQSARWILMPALDVNTLTPNLEDRVSAGIEGKKDKTLTGRELDRIQANKLKQKYVDCEQIMALPVPYDAMLGTEDIYIKNVTALNKNLYGGNHHSATLGHDPILGYVFGTGNILTRSISFKDRAITTRKVAILSGRKQIVTREPYNLANMLRDAKKSICEDKNRLAVAHMKQVLHMQSDKYTKDGLPIPLLSAHIQQQLLKKKWNSKELERIAQSLAIKTSSQYLVAVLLNSTVSILHGFCYDELADGSMEQYRVRTKKIVTISNIMATSLNIGAVASGCLLGTLTLSPHLIKMAISHIDLGGIVEAIHQIVSSKSLQENMMKDFVEMELYNRFCSKPYSFLEECYE